MGECAYHYAQLSYISVTAHQSSDNLLSHPPDNHHSSDDVYWRGGGHLVGTSLLVS